WVTWRDSGLQADVSYDYGSTFNDLTEVNSTYFSGSSISLDSYGQSSIVWLAGGGANNENLYHVSSVIQDNWRPSVISTFPANGAKNESVMTVTRHSVYGKYILVNFSEPMDQDSVANAFSIDNGTVLDASHCHAITWNDYGDKVNFTLETPLAYNDFYAVTIDNTCKDLSGNEMQSDKVFTFSTKTDLDPPVISFNQTVFEVSYDEVYDISVTVIDWWGTVVSASLYFKGVSAAGFTTQALTPSLNDEYTATIPAQGVLGNVSFYFEASDNHNNQGRLPVNVSQFFNYSVVDNVSPVITHIPDSESAVHQPIEIGAVITDEIGLQTVELHYQEVGTDNFTNITMLPNTTYDPNGFSCTIPAQHTIGTLRYNITAEDSAGNLANTSLFTVTITDLTKPEINSVIPEYLENTTKDVIIRANVTDDVAVGEVALYFKAVGGDYWVGGDSGRPMEYVGNNTYRAVIPAQRRTGTIYYYVNATDTSGNLASTLTEQDQFQIEVIGTGTDWTLYIVLIAVLAGLIGILVYLMIKKYKSKPDKTTGPTEASEPGEEADTSSPAPDEGPEQDTTIGSNQEPEPTTEERVDA
ncbi:MAG: Ig-like domain-containing protein, partial [candidate division Zixibacteria bacterium]